MLRENRLFKKELQKRYDIVSSEYVLKCQQDGKYIEIDIIDVNGDEYALDMRMSDENMFKEIVDNAVDNGCLFGKVR